MTGVAVSFDTHKFIKQMISTGFTEEQAETQVLMLSEILDHQFSTKVDVARVDFKILEVQRDIKELETRMETRFKELDLNFRKEMAAMEANMRRDMTAMEANLRKDMAAMNADLKTDLAKLDAKTATIKEELRKEIEVAKNETIKWMVGLALAQLAMMAGILMTLVRILPVAH